MHSSRGNQPEIQIFFWHHTGMEEYLLLLADEDVTPREAFHLGHTAKPANKTKISEKRSAP